MDQDWSTALLTGVSAVVDSQLANQFGINTPLPNTQYGPAGTAQSAATRPVAVSASPAVWIGLAAAVVVLVLVLRK